MTKQKQGGKPTPPEDFADLAAAFADPAKTHPQMPPLPKRPTEGTTQSVLETRHNDSEPDATLEEVTTAFKPIRKAHDVPAEDKRRPGRPKSPDILVNQTLSIRADQLDHIHRIAAAEYARLRRRVLPSEVVRALLDEAFGHLGKSTKVLKP
jgi:hypothetical protein